MTLAVMLNTYGTKYVITNNRKIWPIMNFRADFIVFFSLVQNSTHE